MPAKRKEPDPRIIVPMPKKLIAKIDEYRWANRIPSRAEAIRQLIEAGLIFRPKPK
jgi:metal-responsive CopG/Arc/MetJ family transcriptional regulator